MKCILKRSDGSFENVIVSDEEIKTAFFSLKGGLDKINYDIAKQNLSSLLVLLKGIFDLSFMNDTFPEKIKIAQVTLVFKSSDTSLKTNYGLIYVIHAFQKFLKG